MAGAQATTSVPATFSLPTIGNAGSRAFKTSRNRRGEDWEFAQLPCLARIKLSAENSVHELHRVGRDRSDVQPFHRANVRLQLIGCHSFGRPDEGPSESGNLCDHAPALRLADLRSFRAVSLTFLPAIGDPPC